MAARKRTAAGRTRKRKSKKHNPPHPPRVPVVVLLPKHIATAFKSDADREGKSLSRFLTELLSGE